MTVITSQLMAKPAALKEVCDAVQAKRGISLAAQQQPNPSNGNLSPSRHTSDQKFQAMLSSLGVVTTCSCRPRRRIERKLLTHNSLLSLFTESITTEQHLTGCEAGRTTGRTQKREYDLVYNGLKRILNVAIKMSFATHTGAGAWSIAPTFTYYPTVDKYSSPAFRILDIMSYACQDFSVRSSEPRNFHRDSREWSKLMAVGLSKLNSLLRQNKISPKVVDDENQSLAHYAAQVVSVDVFLPPL